MTEKVKTILTELRRELEKLYGDRLKELILFGSQARGEADEESDIDVAVILNGAVDFYTEIERTGNLNTEISLKYDVALSLAFVSDEIYQEREWPVIINIHKEGIAI